VDPARTAPHETRFAVLALLTARCLGAKPDAPQGTWGALPPAGPSQVAAALARLLHAARLVPSLAPPRGAPGGLWRAWTGWARRGWTEEGLETLAREAERTELAGAAVAAAREASEGTESGGGPPKGVKRPRVDDAGAGGGDLAARAGAPAPQAPPGFGPDEGPNGRWAFRGPFPLGSDRAWNGRAAPGRDPIHPDPSKALAAGWSALPLGVAARVASHLVARDLACFGSACASWRCAAAVVRSRHLGSVLAPGLGERAAHRRVVERLGERVRSLRHKVDLASIEELERRGLTDATAVAQDETLDHASVGRLIRALKGKEEAPRLRAAERHFAKARERFAARVVAEDDAADPARGSSAAARRALDNLWRTDEAALREGARLAHAVVWEATRDPLLPK